MQINSFKIFTVLENLRLQIVSIPRYQKIALIFLIDFLLLSSAIYLSIFVTTKLGPVIKESYFLILLCPLIGVLFFYFMGIYRSVIRFINFDLLLNLIGFISIYSLLLVFLIKLFFPQDYIAISIMNWLTSLLFLCLIRVGARKLTSKKMGSSNVLIYGAGSAGIQLASALKHSTEMMPVAFIDSSKSIQNTLLGGIRVFPPSHVANVIKGKRVDEVLIAIPSAPRSTLRELLSEIENFPVKVRILPGVAELAQGKVLVSELKEVDVSDLLGRNEIDSNQELLKKNIEGKVVLITGAGGSIGSELAKQVIKLDPKRLILLDSSELALYEINNQIIEMGLDVQVTPVLANITNEKRISEIFKSFSVQTIYHAAAYKHVSLVEENHFEAVINNIFGTYKSITSALESEVETFVLISTDKAVRPTNIMGATKRFSEMILQALAAEDSLKGKTRITMVRFGNVLGSSGSAVPMFEQQIREGGPVTVTDPEVVRYFMSITEASELVIQAGAMGEGGDVFLLDMGEPVKILDLAKKLINLSGMEIKDKDKPNGDIEIIFTGLKPGEKLYEELIIGDNVIPTKHKQIFRAEEDLMSWEDLKEYLTQLEKAETNCDYLELRRIFLETVSGFEPHSEISDNLYLTKKV